MTSVIGTEPMHYADAAWLHMDRPANLMVVNTLLMFDGQLDQAAVVRAFEDRVVARFRRFRQRVADPAVTLGPWTAPEWADDAGFATSAHVRLTWLPEPGDQGTLQRVASALASRPLRTDRPLWELHLLGGYGEGSALLLRTHHAIADGVALMQVLLALTDPQHGDARGDVLPVHDDTGRAPMPAGATGRAAHRWTAAARHGASIADALSAPLRAAFTSPAKTADLFSRSRSDAAMLAKLGSGLSASLMMSRNLLQGPLGPGQQRAWTAPVPVEAVKAAGRAAGATVNDLLLTAIAAALRRYLIEHDSLVAEVLVIEPVNLRPAGASLPAGLGNEFGLAFVVLPTGEADPGRRLARVQAQLAQLKNSSAGAFSYKMLELMGQIPAGLQNAWIDMFAASATAIVTNVAGPRHRIQLAGSPVTGLLVWVPATGPVGLGFSAVSYAGQLIVAVASNASLVPDHGRLVALIDEEISALARPDCQVSC